VLRTKEEKMAGATSIKNLQAMGRRKKRGQARRAYPL
jgi:hypothetical protein